MSKADDATRDDDPDADVAIVDRHVAALMEHFDTVQVFVTLHTPGPDGGTMSLQRGAGNWFARVGHVKDWIIRQDAETTADAQSE